ncbi:unnamed protein product, partial [Prorocentrum cordatum]
PASAGGSRVRQSVGELRHPPVRRGRDQKERKNGPRRREGGKQGGREERGLEARIPAADGPERGTQTPLPIRRRRPDAPHFVLVSAPPLPAPWSAAPPSAISTLPCRRLSPSANCGLPMYAFAPLPKRMSQYFPERPDQSISYSSPSVFDTCL